MLLKYSLGDDAYEYFQSVLGFNNALCICLRDVVKLRKEQLNFFVYLKSKLGSEKIKNFNMGGITPAAYSYLPKYLIEQYGNTGANVFIFDDVMGKPSDKYLADEEGSIFKIGDEIYKICDSRSIGEQSLQKMIWACGVSWHFVAVVVSGNSASWHNDVSKLVLCEHIQNGLLEIVIGAFDGEGFIHCSINNKPMV